MLTGTQSPWGTLCASAAPVPGEGKKADLKKTPLSMPRDGTVCLSMEQPEACLFLGHDSPLCDLRARGQTGDAPAGLQVSNAFLTCNAFPISHFN